MTPNYKKIFTNKIREKKTMSTPPTHPTISQQFIFLLNIQIK
jgi:hypothetical protein